MTLRAPLPVKKWLAERHFASLYPSRLSPKRKKCRPIFLHLAPKRQWLKHRFALFARYFSPSRGCLSPFTHCILLQWACCLLHFALRFGAFYLAFWCILHCVLVRFALRFGAFCPAFWYILPQIMLQKALNGVQIVCLNNVQWLFIHLYTHLVLPQTSWRNTRKNVGEQRIGWKNRSHNVKYCTQNVTFPCRCFRQHSIVLLWANFTHAVL